jgi:large subunit ribosomal protein L6e
MPRISKNPFLIRGVELHGPKNKYLKKRTFIKNKGKPLPKKVDSERKPSKRRAPVPPKVKPFGKNGETRVIKNKAPRGYPEETPRHKLNSMKVLHRTRLRPTITPGTVLIILSGRYKAKRVVFLKQLDSGLLMITGPFKINGVPLRRVNQAYVIATKTKIKLPKSFKLDAEKYNDKYFKRTRKQKIARRAAEKKFFDSKKIHREEIKKRKAAGEKPDPSKGRKRQWRSGALTLPDSKKADQKVVDKVVIKAVRKTDPKLRAYLHARFSLNKGHYPHMMKF